MTQPEPQPPDAAGGGRSRRALSLGVKILVGTITLAGTIVAAYVTLVDRPKPYTMDDWRQKANAICERQYGDMSSLFNSTRLALAKFSRAPSAPGQISDDLTGASQSLDRISAAFRAMSADFREIQVPSGVTRTDIDALLQGTSDIAASFSAAGMFFVNYQLGEVQAAELQQILTSLTQTFTVTIPSWSATAKRLSLERCPDFQSLANVAVTPTTASGGLSAGQQALVARLDSGILTNCANPSTAITIAGVTAAVNCAAVHSGPTKQPLVMQFTDLTSMNVWIDQLSTGLSFGDCTKGNAAGTWSHEKVTVGKFVCLADGDSYAMVWGFQEHNIAITASAGSRAAIDTWWNDNAYLIAQ